MTIIQPNKTNPLLTKFILVLIPLLIGIAVWLVVLYNRTVDLNHRLGELRKEVSQIQTGGAEMKERTFALFGAAQMEALAADRKMVKDRDPKYIEIDEQWYLASHF